MTTSQSPYKYLKAQADRIAKTLKAMQRGEMVDPAFIEKLTAAREKEAFSFAVVMDDKTVIIEMPWKILNETGEVNLAEYVLKQMRHSRKKDH